MLKKHSHSGFTLVELAIALVIVALLTGGLLMSLTSQRAIQQRSSTERQLNQIQDAMIGFFAVNGRLPCPATATSNGEELFCNSESDCSAPDTAPQTHGRCGQFTNGFVPGKTLGLSPLDSEGRVLDGWNNPIRYSITDKEILATSVKYAYTKKDGLKTAKLENLGLNLLYICKALPSLATPTDCGTAANTLSQVAPLVLHSTGQNGTNTSNGEEVFNLTNGSIFVSHAPTQTAGTEFDDIVVWLSPNILYNRMIAAGKLP